MKTRKDQPNKKKRKQISVTEANSEFYVEAPSEAQSPETDEQARCTVSWLPYWLSKFHYSDCSQMVVRS